jgi:uncharacterized protein
MKELAGKIVLITGASSGIGRETALYFAKAGAVPVLTARSVDKLEELAAEIRKKYGIEAPVFRLDVQSNDNVQQVVKDVIEKLERIDILVNSSGFGVFESTVDMAMDDFEGMMDVNYFGLVRVTKAVLPDMLRRDSGHIVNIASISSFVAGKRQGGYAATKFAVMGFSEGLHYELEGTGVSLSNVNPGPVETPFFERADRQVIPGNIPYIRPEQVAQTVLRACVEKKPLYIIPRMFGPGIKMRYLAPGVYRVLMKRLDNKQKSAPRS